MTEEHEISESNKETNEKEEYGDEEYHFVYSDCEYYGVHRKLCEHDQNFKGYCNPKYCPLENNRSRGVMFE